MGAGTSDHSAPESEDVLGVSTYSSSAGASGLPDDALGSRALFQKRRISTRIRDGTDRRVVREGVEAAMTEHLIKGRMARAASNLNVQKLRLL